MLFTGKYDHSIDAKQRLAIPAELRSRLDPDVHGEALYSIPGPNGALWLWPERTFEAMAGDFEPTLTPGTDVMDFDEITFPEARRLEIDKAGRIRIPEEMLEDCGLGTRVVVLGMRNHLELRDPDEWEQRRRDRAARRAEIVQRARQEMEGQAAGRSA